MKWIKIAEEVNLPEFKNCIKTFMRWRHYIAERFNVPYANAYTEGKHNLIQTIKRNAFGFRRFPNFRKAVT